MSSTAILAVRPAEITVLGTFEDNGYHDSDFYAIVWDGCDVTVKIIGTTRGVMSYVPQRPATPAEDAEARSDVAPRLAEIFLKQEEERSREPHEGRLVRSLTTRGKNKGFTGTVRKVEVNNWVKGRTAYRLKIEAENGEVTWMDSDKVEVIGGYGFVDRAAIFARSIAIARHSSWLRLVHLLGLRNGPALIA